MKKDNSVRIVAEYRKFNETITANASPVTHINTALENLGNQKIYETPEIREAF